MRYILIGVLVIGLALLVSGPGVQPVGDVTWAAESPDFQMFTIQIDGMTCGSCAKEIRTALVKVPGVKEVEFQIKKKGVFFSDYSDVRSIIKCEPGKTTVNALIAAIEGASTPTSTYKAKPLSE